MKRQKKTKSVECLKQLVFGYLSLILVPFRTVFDYLG